MGMHEWAYKNDYAPLERRLMPHVSLKERFKKLNIEVELGFTAEQTAQEVARCLNCDVQTVFEAKLCIECDACIDICPVDCLTITEIGTRPSCARGCAHRRSSRRNRCSIQRGSSRPAASWSRTRICACTAGCAPSAVPPPPGTCRSRRFIGRRPLTGARYGRTQSSRPRKRFRHQDRDRQRHGIRQRQRPAHEGHLPQRRAGGRQELLSIQHPGAAHLVRDPRHARWPPRPRRPRRYDAGAQCRNLRARPARSGLRRLLAVRLDLAAAGAVQARRRHGDRACRWPCSATRTSRACVRAS